MADDAQSMGVKDVPAREPRTGTFDIPLGTVRPAGHVNPDGSYTREQSPAPFKPQDFDPSFGNIFKDERAPIFSPIVSTPVDITAQPGINAGSRQDFLDTHSTTARDAKTGIVLIVSEASDASVSIGTVDKKFEVVAATDGTVTGTVDGHSAKLPLPSLATRIRTEGIAAIDSHHADTAKMAELLRSGALETVVLGLLHHEHSPSTFIDAMPLEGAPAPGNLGHMPNQSTPASPPSPGPSLPPK